MCCTFAGPHRPECQNVQHSFRKGLGSEPVPRSTHAEHRQNERVAVTDTTAKRRNPISLVVAAAAAVAVASLPATLGMMTMLVSGVVKLTVALIASCRAVAFVPFDMSGKSNSSAPPVNNNTDFCLVGWTSLTNVRDADVQYGRAPTRTVP